MSGFVGHFSKTEPSGILPTDRMCFLSLNQSIKALKRTLTLFSHNLPIGPPIPLTPSLTITFQNLINFSVVHPQLFEFDYLLATKTRKLCYPKDDREMCLIYECPENFWMCIENLKCIP